MWPQTDKDEFLELMNKRAVRKLSAADIEMFEYWAEFDCRQNGEPLDNIRKVQLLGYLTDKLKKTRGTWALLKVQGQLAKKQVKLMVGKDDMVTEPSGGESDGSK